ncbi:MAG: family 16 glycosylhydrolase [Chloroflexi bacterium]|nr:family 16 glycosylhydrolase [Chloroflexota bacterium]
MMIGRATRGAKIERVKNGWRLGIQKGDSLGYRDAQLDDYSQLPRHKYPHQTLSLSLRAKISSSSIAGTWGFGLWNDPFGMSLGFGGNPFRLPALPNAVWFFSASPQNYLSFTNDKPAQGFLAQTFRSPKFHPLLILAGFTLPFSPLRKMTRKLLSAVIDEDSLALSVDVTQWHAYRLEWSPKRVVWYVDDAPVFESPISPNPPLGIIIWIDNQYAAFTPEGRIAFGILEGKEEWLEIEDLIIKEENS